MASVAGFVGHARSFLPELGGWRRRGRLQVPVTGSADVIAFPLREAPAPIASLVESAVIPRILSAHRGPAAAVPSDAAMLARLALDAESDELTAYLGDLVESGIAIDAVLVDHVAPAARHLGRMWEDDDCSFLDVTLGLARLQEAVRGFAADFPPRRAVAGGRPPRVAGGARGAA